MATGKCLSPYFSEEKIMHITAKPVSYRCNLRCDYCFYLGKETLFHHHPMMDDLTLRAFIEAYIQASGDDVYFTWQGGEPTLAGLAFFQKAMRYQYQFAGHKKIHNALQTNGILLNDEWCQFLKKHDFLVGISIDGPQPLHDQYRQSRSGKGTFDRVMSAVEKLKKYGVEFNTLTVVNNINVRYPLEVYRFLKSIGSSHMQFIELLETCPANVQNVQTVSQTKAFSTADFSVPAKEYGIFMSEVFLAWVQEDVGRIFIRQFESTLSRVFGNGHTSCIFQEACRDNFILESDGDLYECDHFVWPEYKIGNIHSAPLSSLASTCLTAQKQHLARECLECVYRPLCNGGCPKHRINEGAGARLSYFCPGYKVMFATMLPYLNAFAELARYGIPLSHIMNIAKKIEAIR